MGYGIGNDLNPHSTASSENIRHKVPNDKIGEVATIKYHHANASGRNLLPDQGLSEAEQMTKRSFRSASETSVKVDKVYRDGLQPKLTKGIALAQSLGSWKHITLI